MVVTDLDIFPHKILIFTTQKDQDPMSALFMLFWETHTQISQMVLTDTSLSGTPVTQKNRTHASLLSIAFTIGEAIYKKKSKAMDNGLEGQRFSQLYSNSDLHSNSWKWIFWFLNLTCTWAKLSFEEKLEKQDFASFNQHQKLVFDFGIHKLAIFLKSIIALFLILCLK